MSASSVLNLYGYPPQVRAGNNFEASASISVNIGGHHDNTYLYGKAWVIDAGTGAAITRNDVENRALNGQTSSIHVGRGQTRGTHQFNFNLTILTPGIYQISVEIFRVDPDNAFHSVTSATTQDIITVV